MAEVQEPEPRTSATHQGLGRSQVLWAKMLASKREQLVAAKAQDVLDIHSFSAMRTSLEGLHAKDGSKLSSKVLQKLDPLFDRVQNLTAAISIFIQSDPTYSALVWGGIVVVLQCCSQVNKTLNKTITMLQSITRAMPRFEQYMELYPKCERLESALLRIFETFTDACIDAIRFFRKKPFYRPLLLVTSSVVSSFNQAIQQMEEGKVEFEREARLAFDLVQAEHRRVVESALPLVVTKETRNEVYSVPFPQNPMFLGRDKELESLSSMLEDGGSAQRSCVLQGIGGVGKTQLALEFTYRCRGRFKYIFWCTAEDSATLLATYGRIPSLLSLDTPAQNSAQLEVELACRWLCENKGWLLVFDNAEVDSALLNQFWPPCQHGSIILTSQRTDVSLRTQSCLRLQPLDEQVGSELLLGNIPTGNLDNSRRSSLARAISKEVDGLPLLLVGLVGFISQSHVELDDVLHALEKSRMAAGHIFSDAATTSATFQYERPIQLVFRLALDRLPSLARTVIQLLSMLSPEETPEAIFLKDLPGLPTSMSGTTNKIIFAKEVRQHLCSRHLIDIRSKGPDTLYSIHRSVQRSILFALDDDEETRNATFNTAVALVYRELPKPSPIMVPLFERWDIFQVFIPHVLALHKVYRNSHPPMPPTVQFAELLCSAAAYFYESSLATLCLDVVVTGEEVCQQVAQRRRGSTKDLEGFSQTMSLIQLEANIVAYGAGVIWNARGIADRQKGHEMTWRVVELRELHIQSTDSTDSTDTDQLLLANAYNDWAEQLLNEGNYSEAKKYVSLSLSMKEEHLDEDAHQFEFYISKIFLAEVALAEGDTTEALRLAYEAIAHVEKEKGPEDLYTLHYKFYLAVFHMAVAEYREAAELLEASLVGRRGLFGETQIPTLDCYFTLALSYFRLGQAQKASDTLRHCLGAVEAANWCRESFLRAEYLHALLKQELGQLDEGLALEARAVAERNEMLLNYGIGHWARPYPCSDQLVYFDYLVNTYSGRTTTAELGRLSIEMGDQTTVVEDVMIIGQLEQEIAARDESHGKQEEPGKTSPPVVVDDGTFSQGNVLRLPVS